MNEPSFFEIILTLALAYGLAWAGTYFIIKSVSPGLACRFERWSKRATGNAATWLATAPFVLSWRFATWLRPIAWRQIVRLWRWARS